MTAAFNIDLARGEKHEAYLDGVFGDIYTVKPVSMELQRQGIDREFTCRATGRRFTVEYKSDERAFTTGNMFVETVSVDTSSKPGWAFTSLAQFIAYYIPGLKLIYMLDVPRLKLVLMDWVARFETRQVQNRGYKTHGLIIPIETVIEACAAGKVAL